MINSWLLALFAAFALTGAGVVVAAALAERQGGSVPVLRRTSVFALVLLLAGGFFALQNIGRPLLVFGALAHPTTAIFREFFTFGLTVLALIGYLVALYRGSEEGTARLLSGVAGLFALGLALSVGSVYWMPWRPAWSTWVIVLPHAGLALVAAAYVFEGITERSEQTVRAKVASVLFLAVCFALWVFMLTGADNEGAAGRLLSGDLANLFWGAAVSGILLPALLIPVKQKYSWVLALLFIFAAATFLQFAAGLLGIPDWQFFRR